MIKLIIQAVVGALIAGIFEAWEKYQDRKTAKRNGALENEAEARRTVDAAKKRMEDVSDATDKSVVDRMRDGTY